ncbi:M48 family metallopeptidase [Plantactinospora sp. GCM10030261]|uniref:M48 family metallopeptidase n=1 Tax=Plantactinospora sp. GCM10030261 TaxID=3273420 RepID=UPI003614F7D2
MTVALRAAISVAMLAGFYLLALGQLAAGIALAIWIGSVTTGALAAKVGIAVFLATVWAVGYGTWKAVRAKIEPPRGLPLRRDVAPQLWGMVDDIARVVGTRAPDEIYLVPDVNAAVSEHAKLMGLVAGKRYMLIGMPLLQAFNVAQLRSVLAHELGHYSGRHTRWAGISYRGREAMGRTIGYIGSGNLAGWIFKQYGKLFVVVHNAVGRQQEIEADQASVRVAGREAAASALREIRVLGAAFAFYLRRYVGPGLEFGYAPDDLFGGFRELLRARGDEIAELRSQQPEETRSRWDTHPPLSVRLAAIAASPAVPAFVDDRPAWTLIPAPDRAGRALQERILTGGQHTVLPWDTFLPATATADLQSNVDDLLRTLSRAVDQPVPHVGAVLDLIGAGRLNDLARPVFPQATREEAGKLFAEPLAALLSLAALRSSAAYWQPSWSGPIRLLGRDGADLDLTGTATLALDPVTQPEARRRLAALGIDPTAARHVQQRVGTEKSEVHGAVVTMIVGGKRTDVLILSHGLLLIPGIARYKTGMAKRRVAKLIESGQWRQQLTAEGSRFIPYEEIVAAPLVRKFPPKYELTLHGGERLEIRWGGQTDQLGDSGTLLAQALAPAAAG